MRSHVTLPSLTLASAAFSAVSALKPSCVDAENNLVALDKCDGTHPPGTFFLTTLGDTGPTTQEYHIDSTDAKGRALVGLSESGLVSGGFGKRQRFPCDPSLGHCVVGGVHPAPGGGVTG